MFENPFSSGTSQIDKKLAELEFLRNQQQTQKQQSSPSMERLDEITKNLSQDRINFVRNQPSVKEKYNTMTVAFNDYIMQKYINEFDIYCDKNKLNFMSDYVKEFANANENYVNPIDRQNETINGLNQRIEEQSKIIAGLQNKSKVDKV